MEFVQKTKGLSDKEEEEEEEDEEEEEIRNFACNFFPHPSQMQWHQANSNHSSQDLDQSSRNQPLTASETINFHGKLQLMDLSLRIDTNGNGAGAGDGGGPSGNGFTEREHMFDKVVTPSDVGKLNRLVIPKQHAEKYFPLDSSTNDKGLILNFEDRIGKPWRFRYSYWNSSQSYVMTKGWSRFVKDKKLDAGDIVSFHRGVGELWKDRLYIDWRRRPDVLPVNNQFTNLHQVPNPLLLLPQSVRWGGRHYTIPPSPFPSPSPSPSTLVPPPRRNYRHHHYQDHWQHMNYSNFHQNYSYDRTNLGTNNSLYYLRPSMASHMMGSSHQGSGENHGSSMVIESVPVIFKGNCNNKTSTTGTTTSTSTAKRLRLFGVNMECAATAIDEEEEDQPNVVAIETDDQISTRGKEPFSINWNST